MDGDLIVAYLPSRWQVECFGDFRLGFGGIRTEMLQHPISMNVKREGLRYVDTCKLHPSPSTLNAVQTANCNIPVEFSDQLGNMLAMRGPNLAPKAS